MQQDFSSDRGVKRCVGRGSITALDGKEEGGPIEVHGIHRE